MKDEEGGEKRRETLLHKTLYSSRNLDKQGCRVRIRDLPKLSPAGKIKAPGPTIVTLNFAPISHEPCDVL